MDITNIIIILLLCVILTLIIIKYFTSNFENSLKINYNENDVIEPYKLEEENNCTLKDSDSKNSLLSSQPLGFTKQIYSSFKYPFVGQPELCISDEHCSQITAECKNNKLYGAGSFGFCGLKNNIKHQTVFDNNY